MFTSFRIILYLSGSTTNTTIMKTSLLSITLIAAAAIAAAQPAPAIVDSCFTSTTPSQTFISTADLGSYNGDLLEWTGTEWIGDFPAANLTIPPPSLLENCRAIFTGGNQWTTGGEGFAVRLTQPLAAGVAYNFTFTYVSHGLYSTGSFSPTLYTYSAMGPVISATNVMSLPPAGYNWTTNTISFTATPAQAGHTWLILHTGPAGTSGMFSAFCPNCSTITGVADNSAEDRFEVYPNPFKDELIFHSAGAQQATVILYDLFGRMVLQQDFTGNVSLSTGKLNNGMYIYELMQEGRVVRSGKVVRD
jgi:hypothetical protein